MSENFIHHNVTDQIEGLARIAGVDCQEFHHQLIDTSVLCNGPGFQTIFNVTTPNGGGLIILGIDIKVLFDTTDATLGAGAADWRSTFDLNPYGPFAAGSGGVGQITMAVDSTNVFATAWDSIINHDVLFAIGGNKNIVIQANPNQPAGKKLQLVPCFIAFSCREPVISEILKKNLTTTVITL